MTSSLQLELFEISETERLRIEIRDLEKSLGNVRRGMFSRHDELEKKYQESREEVEKLKDALNLVGERMQTYETSMFPLLSLGNKPAIENSTRTNGYDVALQSCVIGSRACTNNENVNRISGQ
jgi:Mg2+ and Co2+ transporter CorA